MGWITSFRLFMPKMGMRSLPVRNTVDTMDVVLYYSIKNKFFHLSRTTSLIFFSSSHAWWAALTQELFFLLQRKIVEHLPEEPDGGMVRPVLPFVFSTLKSGDKMCAVHINSANFMTLNICFFYCVCKNTFTFLILKK